MAARNSAAPRNAERSLTITRFFAAPRAAVFAAWTDPAQVLRWMGPRGFTAIHYEQEQRPGGRWRGCIREDATGKELWQGGICREILPPERLVLTFAWDDEDGRPRHETLITVSFEEQDGGTLMTFHQELFDTQESRDGHEGGWRSTFDRLAEILGERP